MALLPSHPTRPTFAPIVADAPLTVEDKRRLQADRRLRDGIHCEFLSEQERGRLALMDYLIWTGRYPCG